MLDLKEEYLQIIKYILGSIVPDCTVIAYGSSVNGNSHKGSDLDLAIIGEKEIPWEKMAKLKLEFHESWLPFKVDVLDLNDIPKHFQDNITANCITIQYPS